MRNGRHVHAGRENAVRDSRPRRWTTSAAVVLIVIIAVCWPSEGRTADSKTEGFRAHHFEARASQHSDLLNLEKPDVLPHLTLSFGTFGSYTDDPLKHAGVGTGEAGRTVVDRELTTDASVAFGLFDRLELGVSAPVVSLQWGRNLASGADTGFPYGDTRASLSVLALRPDDAGGFGLSASSSLYIPTGAPREFTSDGRLRVAPTVAVGNEWPAGHALVANVGMTIGERRVAPAFRYSSGRHVNVGLGGEVRIPGTRIAILGSVFGTDSLERRIELDNGSNGANTARALEAVGGVGIGFPLGLRFQVGGGAGLNGGLPAPDYRVFASLHWRIGDNRASAGSGAASASPDRDNDGLADDEDACPDQQGMAARNGCPAPDRDSDGIPDAEDECPETPETLDGFQDEDGCPDDPDGDGLRSDEDKCPEQSETYNGRVDMDGCSDPERSQAEIAGNEIELEGKISFGSGKDAVPDESRSGLRDVAQILRMYPEITKLRIEGHTDNRGREALNRRLSERRAESVREFLVDRGIASERLDAKGYGESQPIASNDSAAGRKRNRRVEFVIVEIEGEPVSEEATATEKLPP